MKKRRDIISINKLRNARESAKISAKDMADLLGVTVSQIYNIENGYSALSAEQFCIWASSCKADLRTFVSHPEVAQNNI